MNKKSLILSDEWVDRNYVLANYPLSHDTYNTKVKLLDTESYSGYTNWVVNKRIIHKSILDTIFLSDRFPNHNQPHQIRKWVQKHKWNYFGNITPMDSDLNTNQELTRQLFKILKSCYKDLILFFSIENNPNTKNLYHTHFLIKSSLDMDIKGMISQIKQDLLLKEFLFPREIKKNSRIHIDPYDYDLYQNRGLNYVLKFDNQIGLMK